MLSLLAYDKPALTNVLRNGYSDRAGIRYSTASSIETLITQVPEVHANVIVLVEGLIDHLREREIVHTIRATMRRSWCNVLLLAFSGPPPCERGKLGLYDDIVSLDTPEPELTKVL